MLKDAPGSPCQFQLLPGWNWRGLLVLPEPWNAGVLPMLCPQSTCLSHVPGSKSYGMQPLHPTRDTLGPGRAPVP